MAGSNPGEGLRRGMVGLEQLSAGIGIPGQETDALLFAPGECFLMAAVGQTVSILDSDNRDNPLRFLDFSGSNFAEANVTDLALDLHLAKCAERLFQRGAGVDPMKLVKFDALQFEAAQAHLHTLN